MNCFSQICEDGQYKDPTTCKCPPPRKPEIEVIQVPRPVVFEEDNSNDPRNGNRVCISETECPDGSSRNPMTCECDDYRLG